MTEERQRDELILASGSPRRVEILKNLGVRFRVVVSGAPETETGLPEYVASENSAKKALHIAGQFPDTWVLGADTVVAVGSQLLGKPKDDEDAASMLRVLRDRAHEVVTGVCLVRLRGQSQSGGPLPLDRKDIAVKSVVTFGPISDSMIQRYVASGEPRGKAGAYAIQGYAESFVKHLSGSYSAVVGLPSYETRDLLMQAGLL